MDKESSRGIGMRLLAPRLNNRNLIFFGSPAQWPRLRLLLENNPGKSTAVRCSCFLPHSTDIYYKLLHTHTHIPPPIPRLRRFEPPAWQTGLWPAPRMAAGPDGCLLELDYFPCCKVVCLWFMCFLYFYVPLLLCRDHEKNKSLSRENNFCYVEIMRKISCDHDITRMEKNYDALRLKTSVVASILTVVLTVQSHRTSERQNPNW